MHYQTNQEEIGLVVFFFHLKHNYLNKIEIIATFGNIFLYNVQSKNKM